MTKKDQATRAVILQRVHAIELVLENPNLSPNERAFYLGKKEGLMQAYDLAGSTLKCISAEIR